MQPVPSLLSAEVPVNKVSFIRLYESGLQINISLQHIHWITEKSKFFETLPDTEIHNQKRNN